jgi:Na+/H+ antiporter
VTLGIVAGLVVGKPVGIWVTTRVLAGVTRARLDATLRWIDVWGMAMLGGIGFTVSLLIGDLAYGAGSVHDDHVKVGVLCGSVLAAALAAVVLRWRNRYYRIVAQQEAEDLDRDGVPDVYESRQD